MEYRDIFQALKGVGDMNLSSLALPVAETGFALYPINCNPAHVDKIVVNMLTEARNRSRDSFLTYFEATSERTFQWITSNVANDSTRILFALREIGKRELYGYMGLAYGDASGARIEGDAIVRFSDTNRPGLMRKAFLSLVEWVITDIGIKEVWVRVRSSNPAVNFYNQCGFSVEFEMPLYEINGSMGVLEELSEVPLKDDAVMSADSLFHMKYQR
ncbi:GNAT family N-acetyltransferase [Halomonas alkaliantarctica]|uniref:GNAT family N-acetyltransferase n=1 Tax=Halomonas alkaliantarctica TaxID=232346 RepID=A0ABY8LMT8_9GAMM|nr:GNAT family N-acetyltransferase [Halomonas alkaliantarctica]WGI24892.1 GNAT family N-acetyltransferase [Halomonas alkaliantarctica]